MRVVDTKTELRRTLAPPHANGQSVGFVPTMGYLHDGHLSLVRRARRENDVVVVSVFVNPTQFGPNEDLEAYPRDLERDLKMLGAEKTDVVFCPCTEELYPAGYATYVAVGGPMTRTMCGRSRPNHFQGVATIVTKLFHLVRPTRAYFGQKDAQQVAVITQLARDLDFALQVVACPTVREADGLAMSSRNTNLTPDQRAHAPLIFKALTNARRAIEKGERRAAVIGAQIKTELSAIDRADLDYVSITDAHSLADLETIAGDVLIAVAIRLGRTRLIDNIRFEV